MIAVDTAILPRNVEAEAALLGAMMIDNRIADEVVGRVEPVHFFEPVHARIFAAIIGMRRRDMLVTPVTLRPMFEADEGNGMRSREACRRVS